MNANFLISPCFLCGGLQYRRAPFTAREVEPGTMQAVFICARCGMTPFFSTRRDVHQHFAEDDYYESGAYTVFAGGLRQRTDECIADLARQGRLGGKSLLDVGCGEGYALECARQAGATVKGIEPNKSECMKLQARGFDVIQGFGEHYPLGETFDVITLFWVLDATMNPLAVLRRMRQLLKSDGLLVVQLGSLYNMPLLVQRPMRVFVETGRNLADYHPFYFTRASLKACLQATGFNVVSEPAAKSTNNLFMATATDPLPLDKLTLQDPAVLARFFIAWRLRDWVFFNPLATRVFDTSAVKALIKRLVS